MIQNHLEISSKSNFWTRNVRNWSKSLTEIWRNFQDLPRRTHKGPYGPTYGPIRTHIWAHKGPYGPQPGPGPNPAWALEQILFQWIKKCKLSYKTFIRTDHHDGFIPKIISRPTTCNSQKNTFQFGPGPASPVRAKPSRKSAALLLLIALNKIHSFWSKWFLFPHNWCILPRSCG